MKAAHNVSIVVQVMALLFLLFLSLLLQVHCDGCLSAAGIGLWGLFGVAAAAAPCNSSFQKN